MSINLLTHEWAQSQNQSSHFFTEITSTNDVAKSEFKNLDKDFSLYLADHQTQGRGRNENTWDNLAHGEVLLSTWCFRTHTSPQPILTPLLGLALYESLQTFDSSLPLRLKAPNDIYLQDGKLSGLLVEISQQGDEFLVFVGLGLNALAAPQISLETSSLAQHTKTVDQLWPTFCETLFNNMNLAIKKGQHSALEVEDCKKILTALNHGLPEEQQFKKVSPQCDLHTATGVLNWMEL